MKTQRKIRGYKFKPQAPCRCANCLKLRSYHQRYSREWRKRHPEYETSPARKEYLKLWRLKRKKPKL